MRQPIIGAGANLPQVSRRAWVNLDEFIQDLGPLPESDQNAILQDRSLKALNALLEPQEVIKFRDERVDDYGVDGSFELRLHGRMTNFRTQVQLKGTGSVESNKDGSVSFSVRTANLNYLLNGASPIYILFDASRGEFWYVWAQDENRRLETDNSGWKKQETITLRFRDRLTLASLNGIVERVIRERRLHREIHDSLARATASEPVVVRIEPESLKVTNPSQARDILLASGPAIVAAGFPQEAMQLFRLLDSALQDLPRVQMTAGYAEYILGKYYNALGHIRQSIARKQELSERDRNFLLTLKDACEFHVGIIDSATYQMRMKERARSLTGLESLEAEQDSAYHQYLRERDAGKRAQLADRVRRITSEIENHADATDSIRLGARLILIYVEGTEANLAVTSELLAARVRATMFGGLPDAVLAGYRRARTRVKEWEMASDGALRDARALGHPILITEAFLIGLNGRIGKLMDQRLEAICTNAQFQISEQTKTRIRRDIETALALTDHSRTVETKLRIRRIQADFLEIIGDLPAAKEVATAVCPEAEAMGLINIAERAKELLEDRTSLMQFERDVERMKNTDQDLEFAAYSDSELQRWAPVVTEIVGSPPARFEIVRQYCDSMREIAQERTTWCRYIQLKEDLSQTTDPEAAFSVLPDRSCVCLKLGFETKVVTSDAHALIEAFKRVHCTNCPDRSPKQS